MMLMASFSSAPRQSAVSPWMGRRGVAPREMDAPEQKIGLARGRKRGGGRARGAGLFDFSQGPASFVLTGEDLRGGNRKLKGFASAVLLAHLAIGHPEVILNLGIAG